MKTARVHDEIGFDIERAKECANIYNSSVGVQCQIIDYEGKTIYKPYGNENVCNFCNSVENILDSHQSCFSTHLYGSYQAERFGGKYVFFCPMGVVHWVSPITIDNVMRGAMLAGPVQMIEPDDFLIEDIIRKFNPDENVMKEIRNNINKIPLIKPEIVNNLSELLFIVATHVSDVQPSKYLDDRDFHEQQSIISEYIQYIKTMGGNDDDIQSYPIEKENELLSLISLGDKAGSQRVLNEIFGHIFFSTGGNFGIIKARILELTVLLSRAALKGGADVEQIFGLNYKYLKQINSFSTIDELTFWLSKIMARFTDLVFNLAEAKHIDVIFKAIDYIKRNYMKKITLEEVSSHVFLSPSYFSKIFKEEMKVNFNVYLNQVRIEVSKNLLINDSIDLVDLSNLVGYEDQSYFSKVFKKITGVSPGKFREMRGKIKS